MLMRWVLLVVVALLSVSVVFAVTPQSIQLSDCNIVGGNVEYACGQDVTVQCGVVDTFGGAPAAFVTQLTVMVTGGAIFSSYLPSSGSNTNGTWRVIVPIDASFGNLSLAISNIAVSDSSGNACSRNPADGPMTYQQSQPCFMNGSLFTPPTGAKFSATCTCQWNAPVIVCGTNNLGNATYTPGAGCTGVNSSTVAVVCDSCDPGYTVTYDACQVDRSSSTPWRGTAIKHYVATQPGCYALTHLESDAPPADDGAMVKCELDYWTVFGKTGEGESRDTRTTVIANLSVHSAAVSAETDITGVGEVLRPFAFDFDNTGSTEVMVFTNPGSAAGFSKYSSTGTLLSSFSTGYQGWDGQPSAWGFGVNGNTGQGSAIIDSDIQGGSVGSCSAIIDYGNLTNPCLYQTTPDDCNNYGGGLACAWTTTSNNIGLGVAGILYNSSNGRDYFVSWRLENGTYVVKGHVDLGVGGGTLGDGIACWVNTCYFRDANNYLHRVNAKTGADTSAPLSNWSSSDAIESIPSFTFRSAGFTPNRVILFGVGTGGSQTLFSCDASTLSCTELAGLPGYVTYNAGTIKWSRVVVGQPTQNAHQTSGIDVVTVYATFTGINTALGTRDVRYLAVANKIDGSWGPPLLTYVTQTGMVPTCVSDPVMAACTTGGNGIAFATHFTGGYTGANAPSIGATVPGNNTVASAETWFTSDKQYVIQASGATVKFIKVVDGSLIATFTLPFSGTLPFNAAIFDADTNRLYIKASNCPATCNYYMVGIDFSNRAAPVSYVYDSAVGSSGGVFAPVMIGDYIVYPYGIGMPPTTVFAIDRYGVFNNSAKTTYNSSSFNMSSFPNNWYDLYGPAVYDDVNDILMFRRTTTGYVLMNAKKWLSAHGNQNGQWTWAVFTGSQLKLSNFRASSKFMTVDGRKVVVQSWIPLTYYMTSLSCGADFVPMFYGADGYIFGYNSTSRYLGYCDFSDETAPAVYYYSSQISNTSGKFFAEETVQPDREWILTESTANIRAKYWNFDYHRSVSSNVGDITVLDCYGTNQVASTRMAEKGFYDTSCSRQIASVDVNQDHLEEIATAGGIYGWDGRTYWDAGYTSSVAPGIDAIDLTSDSFGDFIYLTDTTLRNIVSNPQWSISYNAEMTTVGQAYCIWDDSRKKIKVTVSGVSAANPDALTYEWQLLGPELKISDLQANGLLIPYNSTVAQAASRLRFVGRITGAVPWVTFFGVPLSIYETGLELVDSWLLTIGKVLGGGTPGRLAYSTSYAPVFYVPVYRNGNYTVVTDVVDNFAYIFDNQTAQQGLSHAMTTCDIVVNANFNISSYVPTECNLGTDGEFAWSNGESVMKHGWNIGRGADIAPYDGILQFGGPGYDIVHSITCSNAQLGMDVGVDAASGGGDFRAGLIGQSNGAANVVAGIRVYNSNVFVLSGLGYVVSIGSLTPGYHNISMVADRTSGKYKVNIDGGPDSPLQDLVASAADGFTAVEVSNSAGITDLDYIRIFGSGEQLIPGNESARALQFAAVAPGTCKLAGDRDFSQQPPGTLMYNNVDLFCFRKYGPKSTASTQQTFCGVSDLQDIIKYNPDCYAEAVGYCADVTWPLSNGDLNGAGSVAERKSSRVGVDGAAACNIALTASAGTTKIVSPLFGLLWLFITQNFVLSMIVLVIIVLGIAVNVRKRP